MIQESSVKLTQFSHGAGCGCKISPKVLASILANCSSEITDPHLLVGNGTMDDAAVYEIDEDRVIISTTDFFMPIVDDPFEFGSIAAVNAISDVYAMGGTPLVAIAILCWPVNVLPPETAGQVLEGARRACANAGISIAGGHSIDGPEPIFGLAVTGMASKKNIRKNSTALEGCELYLTKPLGIGILTTAMKKGILREPDRKQVMTAMLTSNSLGTDLGKLECVKALTDVTGFGLLGHLTEMCEGSNLSAEIQFNSIPRLDNLEFYMKEKTIPGGTFRNFDSYGHKVSPLSEEQKLLLCDPQTSGGLLVAVAPDGRDDFLKVAEKKGLKLRSIGFMKSEGKPVIKVTL